MFSPVAVLIRSCATVVATALCVALLAAPVAAATGVYGAWMLVRAGVRSVRRDGRAAPLRVVRLPVPSTGAARLHPAGSPGLQPARAPVDRGYVGARAPVLRLPTARPRWCTGPSLPTGEGQRGRGHGTESRRNRGCRRGRQGGRRSAPEA